MAMPAYATSEHVCQECFNDDGVKDFVAHNATSRECDFCGAKAKEPIAAPLDEVIDHISACISGYYDDPANTLPYESAEGGYQGATYSTDEVFEAVDLDFPNDTDNRLRDAISAGMPNDLWSDAEPFSLSRFEQLNFSWEEFCRLIKHDRRYFFGQVKRRPDSELYGPSEILRLIFSYAEQVEAFVTLPCGSRIFRARRQPPGKTYDTALNLGPPPVEHAIQTNRMSPPGIVMTYAADDPETALAETANKPGTFAIGEFVTGRDALILDLTNLPLAPSIFAELPDSLEYDPRPTLNFLRSISRDISRPIERDDRVHIEYVPTQVVTEYLRTAVKIGNTPIDGLRYRSSRRNASTALVLFADQENLVLEPEERPQFYHFGKDRWLRLVKATTKTVTASNIAAWAR